MVTTNGASPHAARERPAGASAPMAMSVVVASHKGRPSLDACLASLLPQCARAGVELIVATGADAATRRALERAFPAARFVAAPLGADVPRLRGAGLAAARGELVAQTEDHCVAAEGWVDALMAHATADADVVGGGMGNARQERAIDCGAYFSEYGFFDAARDGSAGGPPLLTGANVAYRRHLVAEVAAAAQQGEWENVIHAALARRGCRLVFEPRAQVRQNLAYRFGAFCTDRYEHGRDYALRRIADEGDRGRARRRSAALLVAAPLLPAVLTYRVARAAGRSQPAAFVRALPYTIAFLTAWSVGEAAAYARIVGRRAR